MLRIVLMALSMSTICQTNLLFSTSFFKSNKLTRVNFFFLPLSLYSYLHINPCVADLSFSLLTLKNPVAFLLLCSILVLSEGERLFLISSTSSKDILPSFSLTQISSKNFGSMEKIKGELSDLLILYSCLP